MTIRSDVNIRDINRDYTAFLDALDVLPNGMFIFARKVRSTITLSIDEMESVARAYSVKLDRCDRIREVEALTFDMIRRVNESIEIEQVVAIGAQLDLMVPHDQQRLIAALHENYHAFMARQKVPSQFELERMIL